MPKFARSKGWRSLTYPLLLILCSAWVVWKIHCAPPKFLPIQALSPTSNASSASGTKRSQNHTSNFLANEFHAPQFNRTELYDGTEALYPRRLPSEQFVTALLPVSAHSLSGLEELLVPFFAPGTVIQDIIIAASSSIRLEVSRALKRILQARAGQEHPEISIQTWDFAQGWASTPAVLRLLGNRQASWALLMDFEGLQALDSATVSLLLRNTIDWRLPYGPNGVPLHSVDLPSIKGREWTHLPQTKPSFAYHLSPPFVFPLNLVSGSGNTPSTWQALFEQVSLCNSWNASGLIVGRPPSPSTPPRLVTDTDRQMLVSYSPGLEALKDTSRTRGRDTLVFDIVLSSSKDVQGLSSLLCGLQARRSVVRILVMDGSLRYSFNPLKHKTRLVTGIENCLIEFTTVNQYMRRNEVFNILGGKGTNPNSDVIITLKDKGFSGLLVDSFKSSGGILIELPREDLPFCDWMATLSLREWQNWSTPQVEISVITRDRPESLTRLLRSLSSAKYYGDSLSLRINIEQDCDFQTLNIARNYSWTHGTVFLHHRVIHGGLLPAVVESWYPRNNDTYGLLLEDDVELSPLFYAWTKMALLRYRYNSQVDKSPKLFGISLYQQKNVELRPEGRIPFHARSLFHSAGLPFPATPYLSQVPCSWGAIYFPEHWGEFHDYLLLRFSESWIPMNETVVLPHGLRSNHWLRSWKKYFIELAYLKGYVMLYPNYEGFMSLSTNHLEYGAHVRSRTKEKRDLFDQPLFVLPELNEAGLSGPTRLLELPGGELPRYRDLPILNLTAGMTTEEDIVRVGRQRYVDLSSGIGNTSSPPL